MSQNYWGKLMEKIREERTRKWIISDPLKYPVCSTPTYIYIYILGLSREPELTEHSYIQFKELAYAITKADKSQDLQSASCRPRES